MTTTDWQRLGQQMKITVISAGAGQVGRTARRENHHLGAGQVAARASPRRRANEVTVVDVNDELLRDLQDRIDIRTVVGSGAQPEHPRSRRRDATPTSSSR